MLYMKRSPVLSIRSSSVLPSTLSPQVFLGLDNAGKTSLLNVMCSGNELKHVTASKVTPVSPNSPPPRTPRRCTRLRKR